MFKIAKNDVYGAYGIYTIYGFDFNIREDGNNYKYAAVDHDGKLHVYDEKPIKNYSLGLWLTRGKTQFVEEISIIIGSWEDSLVEL